MTIQFKEKFFYASGAVANGVKTDAFTFFLLFIVPAFLAGNNFEFIII